MKLLEECDKQDDDNLPTSNIDIKNENKYKYNRRIVSVFDYNTNTE